MTRDELIAQVFELSKEVKAAGVGVKMLSGKRLEEHLAKQPDHMLRTIKRVYEDMLEEKRAEQHQRGCAARHTRRAIRG